MVDGDEQAFTALYRRHQGFVYRFALLMSGRASIAEEVTQEVFLALLSQACRFDPARGSLSAYLCGTARNQVLRLLERERPYVPLVEESDEGNAVPLAQLIAVDDPLSDCARNEANKLVRQAVLALPARYREVIFTLPDAKRRITLGCHELVSLVSTQVRVSWLWRSTMSIPAPEEQDVYRCAMHHSPCSRGAKCL
jgi:RNA polymerase sigma factor (sigma-70 family)